MKTLELLRGRSSANAFDGEPIPESDLAMICEAMSYSPRAANLQHFAIKILSQRPDLERLADVLIDEKYLRTCAAALVAFVDLKTTADWFDADSLASPYPFQNLIGHHYAIMDTMLALQCASLVAEEIGYQTRIISNPLQRAKAAAILFKCPAEIVPLVALTIGKSEATVEENRRHNLDWNTFCTFGIDSPWKSWPEVYENSGKALADQKTLLKNEILQTLSQELNGKTAPEILSKLKYPSADMKMFADNLRDLLVKAGVLDG